MNNFSNPYRARRYLAFVSLLGTTQIHKRNPFTIACWSTAFPGFGHLLLNKYIRGYALVLWEIYINQKIHLNLAMVYSFNGQFQAARDVLDPRFMFLYIPVYLFAIWDSYRTAVDLNKTYVLASREKAKFSEFSMGALEVNYLDKRKPWVATAWSMGMPSVGQLYLHRIVLATFILLSTVVLVRESHLILAVHDLILGDLRSSTEAIDVQWALYAPSFYFFTIYDAYVTTVENNKLFDFALRQHLVQKYQPAGIKLTIGSKVD